MVDRDLGQAIIAYEDPDDGTTERTVANEHVAYFQDHWIVKVDEDEADVTHSDDHDVVRRIPIQRVHYVERSVEEFESEVATLRDQVQSLAEDLRTKVLGDEGDGDGSGGDGNGGPHRIDVETGELDRDEDGTA